jgi:hypothetical protein
MYFITSPAFLALPYCASLAIESGSSLPVFLSVGAGAVAASSLGGVVAIMPAYCAELYGTKNVTAILGGLLAYSTLAATFGEFCKLAIIYCFIKLFYIAFGFFYIYNLLLFSTLSLCKASSISRTKSCLGFDIAGMYYTTMHNSEVANQV